MEWITDNKLPIGKWAKSGVDWLIDNGGFVFDWLSAQLLDDDQCPVMASGTAKSACLCCHCRQLSPSGARRSIALYPVYVVLPCC